jgi:hypothetical protein
MVSSDYFTPYVSGLTVEGYLVLLKKTLMNVSTFVRERDASDDPDRLEYMSVLLRESLRSLYGSLPEYVSQIGLSTFDFEAYRTGIMEPGYMYEKHGVWVLMSFHLAYRTCLVLLNMPPVKKMLRTPRLMSSAYFQTSLQAATEVTELLEKSMRSNPELQFMSPMVCYYIYHCGFVHAVLRLISGNADIRRNASQRLGVHVEALRRMERFLTLPQLYYPHLLRLSTVDDPIELLSCPG